MNKRVKKRHIWFVCLFVLYSIISVTPIASSILSPIVSPIVLLLILISIFYDSPKLILHKTTIFIIVFFIIDVLYHLLGISERIGNAVTRFSCFSAILVFLYFESNIRNKVKKGVFYALMVVVILNIIDNIRLNTIYPLASVLAIKHESYKGMNIGTTMFNTMSLLFYIVCFFMMLNTNSWKGKIVYVLFCIISFSYIVYYGMRGSVVTLLFVSSALMLVVKFVDKYKILWLLLPFLIIPIANPDVIFDIVDKIIPEGRLVDRMQHLREVSEDGLETASFSGRVKLYKVSINTYLNDPCSFLYGMGEHMESRKEVGQAATGVGGHSEFIDVLARWGSLGAMFIFLIFYKFYGMLMRQTSDKLLRNQTKVMFFCLILCGFFKTIFCSYIGIVGFIIMPLAVWMIENEKNPT